MATNQSNRVNARSPAVSGFARPLAVTRKFEEDLFEAENFVEREDLTYKLFFNGKPRDLPLKEGFEDDLFGGYSHQELSTWWKEYRKLEEGDWGKRPLIFPMSEFDSDLQETKIYDYPLSLKKEDPDLRDMRVFMNTQGFDRLSRSSLDVTGKFTDDEHALNKDFSQEQYTNPKVLRKFQKFRSLVYRLNRNRMHWNRIKQAFDYLADVLGIDDSRINGRIIAQCWSTTSQSYSDRLTPFLKMTPAMIKAQFFTINHNLSNSTKEFLDEFKTDSIEAVSDKGREFLGLVREIFDNFYEKISSIMSTTIGTALGITKHLIRFFAIAVMLYWLIWLMHKLKTTMVGTAVSIISGFLVVMVEDKATRDYVLKGIRTHQSSPNVIVAQSAKDTSLLNMVLPPILVNILTGKGMESLGKLWRCKDFDLLVKRLSYLGDPKLYYSFENISHWFSKMVNGVVKFIKVRFLGADPEEFLDEQDDPLTKWLDQCATHFESDIQRFAVFSDSTLSDVKRLYSQGVAYMRHPLYKKDQKIIADVCGKLLQFADKIKKKVGNDASVRNPPITLYLYGETGEGKSTLTYPLCAKILKEIYTHEKNQVMLDALREHYKEMIYVRSSEQEFWDGYTQQLVCVFDDYNQRVDSASNPSLELFEIIRASNIFPYPLHMANLEDKANTVFQSKIIVCSSNNQVPKTESLNYPNALLRRFTKFVKVLRDKGASEFDTKSYRFEQYDPFTLEVSRSYSFEELVDEICDTYVSEDRFTKSVDEFIRNNILAQGGRIRRFSEPETFFDAESMSYSTYLRNYISETKGRLIYNFNLYKQKYDLNSWPTILKSSAVLLGLASTIFLGFKMFSLFSSSKSTRETRIPKVLPGLKYISENLIFCIKCKKISMSNAEKRCKECGNSEGNEICDASSVVAEAYNMTMQLKKVEGYNPKNILKKVESYNVKETQKRVEGQESLILDLDLDNSNKLNVKELHVAAEACSDVNATEQLTKVVQKNMYVLSTKVKGSVSLVGHVFFLRGRICLSPGHYLKRLDLAIKLDLDATLEFESPFGARNFSCFIRDIEFVPYKTKNLSKVSDSDSRDLMYFVVHKAVNHPDVTSFFSVRKELQTVGSTKIQLPLFRSSNAGLYAMVKMSQGSSCIKKYSNLSYVIDEDESREGLTTIGLREAWEYQLETLVGDCGAPLFVVNSHISPGKIIGIHVAGGSSYGEIYCYATPIYLEDVRHICETVEKKHVTFAQGRSVNFQDFDTPEHFKDCEFSVVGKILNFPSQPTKSKIKRSKLYGLVSEPTTTTTWLRPRTLNGQIFDPLRYRTCRMGLPSVPIDAKKVRIASTALIDDIYQQYLLRKSSLEGRFPSSYSYEEAVMGIAGETYVNAIKRSTSCGYPLALQGWTRAKIFGQDEVYDLSTPGSRMLEGLVENLEKTADMNVVPDLYFIDTLKDERKPIHKAHKTRMFSNGPIEGLIWAKKYFNPIVAILSEMRNYCHISVGSNVYSRDWDTIARILTSKSPHIIAGDFEGFDASEQAELLRESGRVLIELSKKILSSSEREVQQMRIIIESLYNSFHINEEGIVIQWFKSLPSGHYLTAIINSVLVNIAMCMAFMDAVRETSYLAARDFFTECGIVAYGDDHLLSVPAKRLAVFNQKTLPTLLLKLGMHYTIETKEDTNITFLSRKITEVSYLKRSFSYDAERQRYVCPLELSVVLEMPMWTKETKDEDFALSEVCDTALRELSLHPEDTWKAVAPRLIDLMLTKLGYVTVFIDYNETREFTLGYRAEYL